MASNDRYVQPSKTKNGWDVVKEGHRRATAHADTEARAVARARDMTRRDGGGEVRVMNRAGKIVSSDTVAKPARSRRSR